jgi:hypothetical protein
MHRREKWDFICSAGHINGLGICNLLPGRSTPGKQESSLLLLVLLPPGVHKAPAPQFDVGDRWALYDYALSC